MRYADLRDFIEALERVGDLRRVVEQVPVRLDMTVLNHRILMAGGPALLFETPTKNGFSYTIPVLTNLFGTPKRVALAMGAAEISDLRDVGSMLARLKEPEPLKGL